MNTLVFLNFLQLKKLIQFREGHFLWHMCEFLARFTIFEAKIEVFPYITYFPFYTISISLNLETNAAPAWSKTNFAYIPLSSGRQVGCSHDLTTIWEGIVGHDTPSRQLHLTQTRLPK